MATIYEAGDLLPKKKKKLKTDDAPIKKKKKKKSDTDIPTKKKKKKSVDADEPVKKKKKKKSVDSDEPVKKKKKKTSVKKASTRDRASILSAKSKLKKHTPVVKPVNEVVEYDSAPDDVALSKEFDTLYGSHVSSLSVEDQEQMQEYFLMFHKLRNIARRFEVKAQAGSSKDVYALMKIYDQMREIIADLKALKDISQIADKLQQDVLIPYSRIVVAELSGIRATALKTANRLLPPENQRAYQEALDSSFISASQKLEEGFNNARFAILDIYSE